MVRWRRGEEKNKTEIKLGKKNSCEEQGNKIWSNKSIQGKSTTVTRWAEQKKPEFKCYPLNSSVHKMAKCNSSQDTKHSSISLVSELVGLVTCEREVLHYKPSRNCVRAKMLVKTRSHKCSNFISAVFRVQPTKNGIHPWPRTKHFPTERERHDIYI